MLARHHDHRIARTFEAVSRMNRLVLGKMGRLGHNDRLQIAEFWRILDQEICKPDEDVSLRALTRFRLSLIVQTWN